MTAFDPATTAKPRHMPPYPSRDHGFILGAGAINIVDHDVSQHHDLR